MKRTLFLFGNPGRDYYFTRHNVGFLFGDRLLEREGILRVLEKKTP